MDFYKDVTLAKWTRKYGEVFDPQSGKILAHVVLTPADFTRRRLNVKMTKWFGQYAKGKNIDYILSRIDHRSMGLYAGDSSWFRLTRTKHKSSGGKPQRSKKPRKR